jgi:hypothetical protein
MKSKDEENYTMRDLISDRLIQAKHTLSVEYFNSEEFLKSQIKDYLPSNAPSTCLDDIAFFVKS